MKGASSDAFNHVDTRLVRWLHTLNIVLFVFLFLVTEEKPLLGGGGGGGGCEKGNNTLTLNGFRFI